MGWRSIIGFLSTCGMAFFAPPAAAADRVEFNRDVRPILSDRCFSCHGPDSASRKSALRLDQESSAKADQAKGKGRFGIVPGDPARSEVFRRISSANQTLRMPPAYMGHPKLPDVEIDILRRWIEQGADYQRHWSFIPPQRPALPEVRERDRARNAIDYFILSRLEREGLRPADEADRPALLRRVTLDLTGLPPTPEELDAFLKDGSPGAYEKVVDRLLASPRYAERMAIRWLEAARYADTNGYQTDGPRDMWRWRDWVIDAFHRNMPFDQFTIEQIAGDLLPNASLSQRIATAFNRNHRTTAEGGIVDEEFRVEYVADRAETTATVWLGLTAGCARCHDHKYDPISQKEFYRLFAFFNNVPEKGFVYNFGNEEPYIKAPLPEQQRRLDAYDAKLARLRKHVESLEPKVRKAQGEWEKRIRKSDLDWTVTAGQVVHQPAGPASGEPAVRESAGSGEASGRSAAQDKNPADSAAPGDAAAREIPNQPEALRPVAGPPNAPTVGALQFDGKNFLATGKDAARLDYRDPFTFAAWIKPEADKGAILSRAEDYFEGTGHALHLIGGKVRLHVIFRWTDLGMRVETVEPVKLNQWQHVAATYDGSMKAAGVQIYIDGQPQKLKILFDQCIWPMDSKQPFRIGAGGGLRFQGAIADARVYYRELNPDEAAVLPLGDSLGQIAAIPAAKRSKAQSDKLRMAFLEKYAPADVRRAREEVAAAEKERHGFYDTIPTVMVMAEREQRRDTFVLQRGAYDAPGEKVAPGTPAVLPPMREDWPDNRLGLARWLVDRTNPLTARVTVNRFWQTLFGTGLVKTVEDFGSQGEWPVYPRLLDWLAVEFMESGWDVKGIIRTIVTSAAYRRSSEVTPALLEKDPDNRLLARGPRLRLPPEMIRDQALAWSGLLVEKVGGPSVKPYQPPGLWQELQNGKGYEPDKGEGLYRRSLYSYWRRTVAPPSMVTFDSPDRETCVVRETRTNTPLQALNLMNDVIYLEAARKLAERLLESGATAEERLERAVRVVLARPPRAGEMQVLKATLGKFEGYYRERREDAESYLKQGDSPRNPKFDARELAAYAAVANLLMNTDQAVTKE